MAAPADLPLGVIEGYYGRPWSWEDRTETATFLAAHGYRFFIYAPKADAFLRMSPFLHLRAFTGRSGANAAHLAGHAINPALQPVLSRIPAITLPEVYALGDSYDYRAAFDRAALRVLGPALAPLLAGRVSAFQDLGLDRLDEDPARLQTRFAAFDHPAAREILAWLVGAWRVTSTDMEGA